MLLITEVLSLDVKFTKRCEGIEEIFDNKADASKVDELKSTLDEYEEKIDKIAEKRLTSANLKILKSGVMNRNRKLPNELIILKINMNNLVAML